ncbi:MAG: hypothetical protein DRQ40_01325 [Gammaproteobacteria bacterium]|nr:MAG: hypothetical protein DRQ40_01325 [Gammaproteobacteria bacterium]
MSSFRLFSTNALLVLEYLLLYLANEPFFHPVQNRVRVILFECQVIQLVVLAVVLDCHKSNEVTVIVHHYDWT